MTEEFGENWIRLQVSGTIRHWSPEEADCIYQLLDNFKEALWQCYGDEIVQMHKARHEEQLAFNAETDFDDELPF